MISKKIQSDPVNFPTLGFPWVLTAAAVRNKSARIPLRMTNEFRAGCRCVFLGNSGMCAKPSANKKPSLCGLGLMINQLKPK